MDTDMKQKDVAHKRIVQEIVQEEGVQYEVISDGVDQVNQNKELLINFKNASLFDLFIVKFHDAFKNQTVTKNELKDELKVTTSQLDEWLKMGVENNYIIKKLRPVSYIINPEMTIRLIFN